MVSHDAPEENQEMQDESVNPEEAAQTNVAEEVKEDAAEESPNPAE